MPALLGTIGLCMATAIGTSAVFLVVHSLSDAGSSPLFTRPSCSHSTSNAPENPALLLRGVEFGEMNARLLGPDSHGGNGCPSDCGCAGTPKDCPRWYDVAQIERFVSMDDPLCLQVIQDRQTARTKESAAQCEVRAGAGILAGGGWCLDMGDKHFIAGRQNISIAANHVMPSHRIVEELSQMIENEGIKSINDFGAGVGQYKAPLLEKFPNLTYLAYDGAGNVEKFTHGYLKHFDLTLPLHLPKADWVMSLEVGEHIPSKYEGVVIRNIHAHNCKGVILSWGVLGQNGYHHVNDHSNEYIISVFRELGYRHDSDLSAKFRNSKRNYGWFRNSVMVFRRLKDAC